MMMSFFNGAPFDLENENKRLLVILKILTVKENGLLNNGRKKTLFLKDLLV